ncbi:MAG TPA: hypothetical protein VKE41_07500 [Roseiflexaceae bacterium]|nr:hypothetical protein [Roseiflexaceae bacterium]
MPTFQGYKLTPQVVKQRRPFGVAVLATIGVLGSLAGLVISLVRLLGLLRASAGPSLQLAAIASLLVLALVVLWINWGVWELIGWAWWANILLTLVSIGALIVALRWAQPISAALAKLLPMMIERQVQTLALVGLLALLVYHLIAVVLLLGSHAAFGVGVKDERPLWERMQRR